MARRSGRPGSWLMVDDTTGFVKYSSQLRRDFWGNMTAVPLKRNLQEIASPLNDPAPVPVYRGPNYEASDPCGGEVLRPFVSNTNVPTSQQNMAAQALNLDPSIPDMSVGCTLVVR